MSRSVAELRSLALFHRKTFHRNVSTEVYLTEEGALAVCKLVDNYHDMELAMLVDPVSYEVKDIAATMHRYPFETCVLSFESYKRLIGLKIMGGGVLHKVHQLIPRVDGCSHLYTALEACLRGLFIGAGYEEVLEKGRTRSRSEQQVYLKQLPLTRDTCVSFRTDGLTPTPPSGVESR